MRQADADPPRAVIEAHLMACRECLADFIAIKREIETAESDAAPSLEAQRKLRLAVAEQVGAQAPVREWSWWERPAAFLFAGAAVMVALLALQVVSTGPGVAPHALSGESRPAPTRVR